VTVPAAALAQPQATFRPPVVTPLATILSVRGLVTVLVPTVLLLIPIVQWLGAGRPSDSAVFMIVWVIVMGAFFVPVVSRLVRGLWRFRRQRDPSDSLRVGPGGIWLPELDLVPWGRVAEVRTARAGFTRSGGGPVERWRLVVVESDGRTSGVESDELDAAFDDVLDLVRFYHPVMEAG
jgi:membrane protein YdbS with pleckstrin-like domain